MTTFIQEIKLSLYSNDKQVLEDLRVNAYGDLDKMLKAGVFSFKSGHAEIFRDDKGLLREIRINQRTYKE